MDFTAVAHDLRAPLSAMLGHTRLLAAERLSDAGRHRLEIIENQIRRMTRLIDGYLPQQALIRGTALVDLDATLRDVVAELEGTLQRRGVQMAFSREEALPPVAGDGGELHRVLMNLIVNAVDAMPGGGRIVVDVHTERLPIASMMAVAIDITDSGTGIPSELVPRLFERGFTTKPPGEGTGLGLAICREIVESHGGGIELSSVPGHGTTVRVSLLVDRYAPSVQAM